MKRPFAYLGFSYALWLLVAFFLPEELFIYIIIFAVAASLLLSCFVFIKKSVICRYYLLSAASLIICLVALHINSNSLIKSVDMLSGSEYKASGEVIETLPKEGASNVLKIRVDALYDDKKKVDISDVNVTLYSFEEILVDDYDEIIFTADFYAYEENLGISSAKTKYADGLHLYAFESAQENIQTSTSENKPIFYYLGRVKAYFENALSDNISNENVDLLSAMLLGNRNEVDYENNSLYSLLGISHVLVVSGMHIAVLSFALIFILKRTIKKDKIVYAVAIAFIIFYMAICGFGFSVIRSGIMLILICLSKIIGADVDGLNSLGLAAFIICVINPYAVVDLGFILSVSATLGIILVYGKLTSKRDKLFKPKRKFTKFIYNGITGAFLLAFSANLFTIPVILLFFNSVNLLGFINSALLSPLFSLLIIVGFILLLISALPFAALWGAFIDMYMNLLNKILLVFSDYQTLTPTLPDKIATMVFLSFVAILLILFIVKRGRYTTIVAGVSLAMIYSVAIFSSALLNADTIKLIYMPTNGKPFVAVVENDKAAVVSSGESGYSDAAYFMKDLGVREIVSLQIIDASTKERQTISEIEKLFEVETIITDDNAQNGYIPFESEKVAINYSYGISRINVYGNEIILEEEGAFFEEESADLAFLNSASSDNIGTLNVLAYHSFPSDVKSGNYIISGEEKYIFTFDKDDSMKIRSEK